MNQMTVLFATIEAALQIQSQPGPLPADEVKMLGRQLGLTDERTFDLICQLSAEGKVVLEWGGAVKSVKREPSASTIHQGDGSILITGGHFHKSPITAGVHVENQSASKAPEESPAQIVAKLTAPIVALTAELNGLTQAQQEACHRLIELTEMLQKQLLSSERTDKKSLLDEADRAMKLINRLWELGTAAAPHLAQVLDMLHHALQSLPRLLGL